MIKALYRLPVYMRDQIRRSQSGLERRASFVHCHHQMMHRVEIRISVVNPNGVNGEAETSRSPSDDQWWLKISD